MKSIIFVTWPSLCVLGLLVENEFFRNVALGLVWFTATFGLVAVFAAMGDNDSGAELREVLRKRPAWRKRFGRAMDISIGLLLAGHGYWWAFAFFTVQALGSVAAEDKAEKELLQEGSK